MKKLTSVLPLIILFCLSFGGHLSYAEEPNDPPPSISSDTGKININAADANLLANTLKGIGLKKARSIVEYRNTYGPFHNIQELAEVSGIGTATMEKNAALIAVK